MEADVVIWTATEGRTVHVDSLRGFPPRYNGYYALIPVPNEQAGWALIERLKREEKPVNG